MINCPENRVEISIAFTWPGAAAGYSLQQNPDLNPGNWTTYTGPVNTNGATKTATLTPPTGNLFFRLFSPSP